jgi:hypothetical protein
MKALQLEAYGKNLSKIGCSWAIVVFKRFVMGCWRGNKTSRKLHIDSDAVVGYVDLFTREKIG